MMQQCTGVFFQPREGVMLLFGFLPAIVSVGEVWVWNEEELCPFYKPEICIRRNTVV